MNENKQKIIDMIKDKVDVFTKVSAIQYRIRCPICGDSQKNLKDAHFYIKCSFDPDEPILYNCFKCNSKGRLDKYILEKLDIPSDLISDINNTIYNKIQSTKKVDFDLITGAPIIDSPQVRYIRSRLGKGFSLNDFDKFKIIWDMSFVFPYVSQKVKNTLPNNSDSISFLSEDKSVLLTRFFHNDFPRWKNTKLYHSGNKSFYTIKSTIDLLTNEPIVVNIAEGIFDILSVYKNFYENENSIHVSTLGSDYEAGINHIIQHGFVGSNITPVIYIDSDIDEKILKYQLRNYKWLFNKIYIRKNIKSEDFGTTIENIKIVEYIV